MITEALVSLRIKILPGRDYLLRFEETFKAHRIHEQRRQLHEVQAKQILSSRTPIEFAGPAWLSVALASRNHPQPPPATHSHS